MNQTFCVPFSFFLEAFANSSLLPVGWLEPGQRNAAKRQKRTDKFW